MKTAYPCLLPGGRIPICNAPPSNTRLSHWRAGGWKFPQLVLARVEVKKKLTKPFLSLPLTGIFAFAVYAFYTISKPGASNHTDADAANTNRTNSKRTNRPHVDCAVARSHRRRDSSMSDTSWKTSDELLGRNLNTPLSTHSPPAHATFWYNCLRRSGKRTSRPPLRSIQHTQQQIGVATNRSWARLNSPTSSVSAAAQTLRDACIITTPAESYHAHGHVALAMAGPSRQRRERPQQAAVHTQNEVAVGTPRSEQMQEADSAATPTTRHDRSEDPLTCSMQTLAVEAKSFHNQTSLPPYAI